ncbi:glycine zipper 2TM domain-containing protein [Rhodoferax sp.]|uniref:glycine zipper 2TM domain-containing protein n=1 Tax=Rhodoferax sp. TaxID=50421 RepID=UPI0019EEBB43|nr:glycine zipper 2TM domain-containing protein [Rhodoferax sp.]MBE0474967.1 glycine zipper 2TM domain-containing protein [Rhodoferax sp.]
MKRLTHLGIASLFATALFGAQAATFTDNARVRSAEPQYESINVPRNECSSHWVDEGDARVTTAPQNSQSRQYGGAIVGGLAGGVLGHQVGGGRGKDAATVVGAVLGAIAGDHLENRNAPARPDDGQYANNGRYQPTQREVQRCRTVYDVQSRITGYRVTYDYRGQQYTTFMRSNPGDRLPVRVSVEPIEQ